MGMVVGYGKEGYTQARPIPLEVCLPPYLLLQKEFKCKTRPSFVVLLAFPQIPPGWFVSRIAGCVSGSDSISGEAHGPWWPRCAGEYA